MLDELACFLSELVYKKEVFDVYICSHNFSIPTTVLEVVEVLNELVFLNEFSMVSDNSEGVCETLY